MKLSEIIQSRPLTKDREPGSGGSWGIFRSPDSSGYIVKLFYSDDWYDEEISGYEAVMNNDNISYLASEHHPVTIVLDTEDYQGIQDRPPSTKALIMPYLQPPLWKHVGKFSDPATKEEFELRGINYKEIERNLEKAGLASWEVSFFVNQETYELKAIDFTPCKLPIVKEGDS